MEPGLNPGQLLYSSQLLEIVQLVRRGNALCFATESSYALGGLAFDERALERVLCTKGREQRQTLPLVCADLAQVEQHFALTDAERALAEAHWPAPLSILLRPRQDVPAAVRNAEGFCAVRVPASASLRALCRHCGPLSASSANRHGQPPALTADECLALAPDAVIDEGPCPGGAPSTILHLAGGQCRVLRAGALESAALQLPPDFQLIEDA